MNLPSPGTYDGQLAQRAAELIPDMNNAERLELLNAMDPDDMRASLAWLAAYAPRMFDFAFVRDREMVERLQDRLDGDRDGEDDLIPYCAECGATIGVFIGHGSGYHHFRGSGTVESPNELYDPGHGPVVTWRVAGKIDQIVNGDPS